MNKTVRCPKCAAVNTDQAKFCARCGTALQKACLKCAKQMSVTARFCPACGHDTVDSQEQEPIPAPAPIPVADSEAPMASAAEASQSEVQSFDLVPAKVNIAPPIRQQEAQQEAAPAPVPEAKPEPASEPIPALITAPVPQTEKFPGKKPNRTGLVWMAGAVVAVMAIVGGAYYFYAARPVQPSPIGAAPEGENLTQPPLASADNPAPPPTTEPTIPVIAASPEGGSGDAGCTDCGNKPQEEPSYSPYLSRDIRQLALDQEALNIGRELFLTHCANCHRPDGKGQRDVPDLTDNRWLFGGDPGSIQTSIAHGRAAPMPAFPDASFGEGVAKEMANYVLRLGGKSHNAQLADSGRAKYQANSVGCHGESGKGNQAVGFPDLTDDAWRFGGNELAIAETIMKGRMGGMPPFLASLGEAKIHLLTAYVYAMADKRPSKNSVIPAQQAPRPAEPVFISRPPQPEPTRPSSSLVPQSQPRPAPPQPSPSPQANRPSNPIEALVNREIERLKRCQGKWGKTPDCPQGNWNTEESF